MLVTLSGMVTDINPAQPEKAYRPISVTFLPMVTPVTLGRLDEPLTLNIFAGMLVTLSPNVTLIPSPDVPAL